jgi:hypothetical protein
MPNVWPPSLPQYPTLASMTLQPQSTMVETAVTQGRARRRPLYTSAKRSYPVQLEPITATQLATFESFYETTCLSGTQYFSWLEPLYLTAATVQFSKDPYTVKSVSSASGGPQFVVSFILEVLPAGS